MTGPGVVPLGLGLAVTAPHPTRFSREVLWRLAGLLDRVGSGRRLRVLDPFAGTGRVHHLVAHDTVGVEIEGPWAAHHPRTLQGDATSLPFGAGSFDAVVTSPAYGNRFADGYDGRDGSTRSTYRICLGRPLHPRSGARLQWGPAYRALHEAAWVEAYRVLRPGGVILVNVADHVRQGKVQPVTGWHADALARVGFTVEADWVPVPCPGFRSGANRDVRTDGESILVAHKSTLPVRGVVR